MNKQLTLGICIFILLAVSVNAISTSYETASVSRLVGNAPEDLINQLDTEELNLNHASYYPGYEVSKDCDAFLGKKEAIEHMFDKSIIDIYWEYDDIETSKFEPNELFIIESEGSIEGKNILASQRNSDISPRDIEEWKDDFAKNNPLFIFDSDYAGIAIPNQDTYVSELTRYSTFIAPTLTDSRKFTEAMICNIGDEKTIGNTFREARNTYFSSIEPSRQEAIGLTLNSYHLYGNPTAITTTPNYNRKELERYCGNLLGEKEETPFGIQELEVQNIKDNIDEIVYISGSKETVEEYEILNLAEGTNIYADYELVKPIIIKHHDLPLGATITDITYTFSEEETVISNIPEYKEGLVDRSCYENTEDESFETSISYKEDKQTVNLFISPLKMTDCNKGEFKLYKKVHYIIEYITPSPIYFDDLEYPIKTLPNNQFDLIVSLGYVKNTALNGELELYQESNMIFQKEITSNIPSIKIPLTSQDQEGIMRYTLKYVQDGEVLAETEFEVETRVLDYILEIPEMNKGKTDIKLKINNNKDSDINIKVNDNLLLDSKIQGGYNEFVLEPGLNEFSYSYDNLLQSEKSYKLRFDMGYNNKQEVLNGLIVTNHKPIIEPISNIFIEEGEIALVDVSAYDPEEDNIEYSIDDQMFVQKDNIFTWQTQKGDAGEYSFTVTASDGYSESKKNFKVTVNEAKEGDSDDDEKPECTYDSDCGSNKFIGESSCSDGNIYRDYQTWECVDAECISSVESQLKDICDDSCSDGKCISIACSSDLDCGTDNYRGSSFCKDGDVYRYYREYTCSDPGTSDSLCRYSDEGNFIIECKHGCEQGICRTERICSRDADCGTDGFTDEEFCKQGDVWDTYETYSCLDPETDDAECSKTEEETLKKECINGCSDRRCVGEPVCSVDSDCGTDRYIGEADCSGNGVIREYRTYTCSEPGTADAECSYSDEKKTIEECEYGCKDGGCISEDAIICHSDSDCGKDDWTGLRYCKDGDSYRKYKDYECIAPGTAESECRAKEYEKEKEDCSYGCSNGFCMEEQGDYRCSKDSDCGREGYISDKKCVNDDVFQTYRTWACHNPDSKDAYCRYSDVWRLKEECSSDCSEGRCMISECSSASNCGTDEYIGELFCSSGDVYQKYRTWGCDAGKCSYSDENKLKETCSGECIHGICIVEEDEDLPDIQINYLFNQDPKKPKAGDSINMLFDIQNLGDEILEDIEYKLYTGSSAADKTGVISSLYPGKRRFVAKRIRYDSAGTYYPRVAIDHNNKIAEKDEGNNFKEMELVVG